MEHEVAFLMELGVNPSQFDAVRGLLEEMIASGRAEPGALSYAVYVSDDGRTVAFYERYADSAAVLAHMATFGEQFAPRFLAALTPTRRTSGSWAASPRGNPPGRAPGGVATSAAYHQWYFFRSRRTSSLWSPRFS